MAQEKRCLALRVRGVPSGTEAEAIIRRALQEEPGWGALEIEIFPGREDSRLLAHPAEGVYIRRAAVEYLLAREGSLPY